jgi:hypothetical protein|tara:strand:- start:23 stop:217 length:195 start_codon:yes stop_codon:yes gene_type:complete
MSVDVTLHDIKKIEVSDFKVLTTSDTTRAIDILITHRDWKTEEVLTLTLFGTEEELGIVFQKDE